MHAIYINAITKKVEAALVKDGCVLASLYGLLACRTVEAVTLHTWSTGERETLWIDEEGRLGAPTVGFAIGDGPIYVGSGVILCCDLEGDSQSTHIGLSSIRSRIRFLEFDDANPAPEPFCSFVSG